MIRSKCLWYLAIRGRPLGVNHASADAEAEPSACRSIVVRFRVNRNGARTDLRIAYLARARGQYVIIAAWGHWRSAQGAANAHLALGTIVIRRDVLITDRPVDRG